MTKPTLIAKSLRCAALLASTAISTAALANDLPTGGEVAAGAVSIGAPAAGNMTITQHSDRAVVNWTSFSVGEGNAVNIAQPGAQSALLNRVTGDATSVIAGQINANGQVFLVNPNGIAITKSGTVNAAAFTASTLDISDRDFMAGGDAITVTASANAQVMRLRAGLSDLMSPDLADGTLLVAGVATMEGSDQAALDLTGDGFLRLGLPTGSIEVAGTINANTVVLTAGTARDAARGVVNLSGVINATGVESKGGVVRLTGDVINLTGATIDASGTLGGGSIEIGGGYQGTGDLAHATDLNVDAASVIRADALVQGDGGDVVLWSDHKTAFAGTITARGGANSGDGGNAEVSGKALLAYTGFTNLLAPKGKTGDLLLDPYDVTILDSPGSTSAGFTATGDNSFIDVTTLTNALGSANVTVSTGSGGSQAGNITVVSPIFWNAATTLELSAAGDIAIIADIASASANAGLILRADNDGSGSGTVTFGAGIVDFSETGSTIDIYYNPTSYASPTNYSGNVNSGTLTSWMLVNTLQNLQDMNTNLAGTYALSKSIDASETASWNSGAGFAPIGNGSSNNFTGKFDGQGHVISGLTINRPTTNYVGLFGYISDATISNVGLEGGSISGNSNVGGLVGEAYNNTTISNAYATGAVSGTLIAGGLVGEAYNNTMISNAYATGTVSGNSIVGGLVGRTSTNTTISNAYATGAVSEVLYAGGLVGFAWQSTISNSYWDVYSTRQAGALGFDNGSTVVNVSSVTSDPAKSGDANYAFKPSAYANFDFTNDWFMVDGSTRPFGRWEYATDITNAHQLQLMAMNLSASYTLGAKIDLSETGAVTSGSPETYAGMWSSAGFSPVGDGSNKFTGTFDGQGHIISGLTIERPDQNYVGLFGYVDGGSISNVGLEIVSVSGYQQVGGLAARADNAAIENAHTTGTVSGNSITGALSGYTISSTIRNVYSTASVEAGPYSGGLIGSAVNTAITNAYATGSVDGGLFSGGLIGSVNNSAIANAYATGSVTAGSRAGGLIGSINKGSITNAYATGLVSGSLYVGGLVGNATEVTVSNSYWDSYGTGQSEGIGNNSGATIDNVLPVTSDPAQSAASNYAFKASAWSNFATGGVSDLDTVGGQDKAWRIYDGHTTPLLKAFMTKLEGTASGGETVTYNGAEQSLTPTFSSPYSYDESLILGLSDNVKGTDAGSYSVADNLYSVQQGYDLVLTGSGALTITPRALTVTYTANAASSIYGNTIGTLPGTATASGLQGSDTLANVTSGTAAFATTAGKTSNVGSYAITGSGLSANSGNYTFTFVQADANATALTITPRALTVTYIANAASSIYGDAISGLTGEVLSEGLVNGDELSGTASWTTIADGKSNVGGYAITGSGLSASANYDVTTVQADANANALTITPRALTVTYTANAASSIYGDAISGLTGSVSNEGLVNGDELSGTASWTTIADGKSNVGGYAITGSGLSASANYDVITVQADAKATALTITPRALTVTYAANASQMTAGGNLPSLGGTVSQEGLVNGDELSGTASWTTPADSSSEAGSYAITGAGVGASANYTVTAQQAEGNATALTIVSAANPNPEPGPNPEPTPEPTPAPIISGATPDITAGALYGDLDDSGEGSFLGSGSFGEDTVFGDQSGFESIESFCEDGSC
ncbi:MAG: hypothetical protein B7Y87_00695 [Sphingomonadales bacterium 32-64-22]|nr:MAG: hypothetical protein B7Y87_00695 [Sphingomonadales bacterium 32-64-22]